MIDINKIEWLEPWSRINGHGEAFIKELIHELNCNHPLFNINVSTVARRDDCDDVLFELTDSNSKFAVVHLTWSKTKDNTGKYPRFNLYNDINEWIENCMKVDHKEFKL